ncbi:MAG: hypothetical protein J7M38_02225 [Armatimonadetes bacterium]|nr:hypothetical protein [Armatimonadota bacterium]
MNRRAFVLSIAATCLTVMSFAASIETPYLRAALHDPAGGTIRSLTDAGCFGALALSVEVTDGKSGRALDVGDLGGGLRLSQQVEPVFDEETEECVRLRWLLRFDNTAGAQQRWLMVRVVVTPDTDAVASFWNGEYDYHPCTADVLTGDFRYDIPLVALYGGDAGLAWGIEPDVLLSYFEGGADFTDGRRFWFGCKLVMDAGATEALPLTVFGFRPVFGYLDAFERYDDLFPEVFAVDGRACDPRCTGPGCDYTAWHKGSPELVRRFRGTWDWCMRGFQVAGNWARRRELWRGSDKQWDSFNRYIAEREENLRRCRVAGMRYFAPTWTDVDLAAERWPDARCMDPSVNTIWKKCLTTDCHMTFPARNSYFDYMKRDLADIMASGAYAGFGLDCGATDGKFRGEGAQLSPGRAWDEQGVYVRLALGTAQLMDFIHTLDASAGKAGVVPNNGDYSVLARADAVLIEHSPTRLEGNWNKRLMAGEKVMSWWDDFDLWTLTDYEGGERERLRRDVAAMARFIRLRSYQMGGVPMYRQAAGIRSQVEALARLARVVTAGWQPVPAMIGDERLMPARYGDTPWWYGGVTYLVAGNPTAEAVAGDIEVFGEYLGGSGFLIADDTGRPLAQTVKGMRTTLHTTVPAAWESVFLPCAEVLDGDLDATVSVTDDLSRVVVRVEVSRVKGKAAVRPFPPPGCRVGPGTWRGRPLSQSAGVHEPWQVIISRPGVLEATFIRPGFACTRDDLLDFQFVRDDRPACSIVIPPDAVEDERYAAFRLQEYFRFLHAQPDYEGKPTVEGDLLIPIVSERPDGPCVIIERADLQAGCPTAVVAVEGGDLHIRVEHALTGDDSAATEAVLTVLDVLDARYIYRSRCTTSFESDRERAVYERAGLVGEFFDDTRYLPAPAE